MGCNCKKKKKIKVKKRLKRFKFKIKQIKNFFTFLCKNILSGFKQVKYKDYQNRLSICRGCPFLSYKKMVCTDCGCHVKNKAKFKTEDCPQGYWEKL
jgi:hypothetical protein